MQGASTGTPVSIPTAITGKPKLKQAVTIKPKTAADQVLTSLSAATLPIRKSNPTAIPTDMSALMATVKPKFHPEGCDLRPECCRYNDRC